MVRENVFEIDVEPSAETSGQISFDIEKAGPQGLSAYEVAVKEGYSGTEQEWLDSLKGDVGDTPEISIGTTQTLPAGSDAIVTNTGTIENPIFNFGIPRGSNGSNGSNGKDGKDGVDGTNGQDGVGVPSGGTTGQILAKTSNTDYATEWINAPNPDLSNYLAKDNMIEFVPNGDFNPATKKYVDDNAGSVDIDESSITLNSSDKIQTVGVIDNNSGNTNKLWTGTLAQYNAIQTKNADTFYYITDDDASSTLRQKVEVITSSTSTYTIANLTANKVYKLGELTSLTITACETFDEESIIYFDSGSTATILSLPNDVVQIGDTIIEANYSYIISVLNKIAVIRAYEVE